VKRKPLGLQLQGIQRGKPLAGGDKKTQERDIKGLGRESLYKDLSNEGNPEFATVLKVLQALGLRLQVVPTA
jgi:hypothetical protein